MRALTAKRDLWGGALMLAFGIVAIVEGERHTVGSLTQMGSGYFPIALGVLLSVLGLVIVLGAVFSQARSAKGAETKRSRSTAAMAPSTASSAIPELRNSTIRRCRAGTFIAPALAGPELRREPGARGLVGEVEMERRHGDVAGADCRDVAVGIVLVSASTCCVVTSGRLTFWVAVCFLLRASCCFWYFRRSLSILLCSSIADWSSYSSLLASYCRDSARTILFTSWWIRDISSFSF